MNDKRWCITSASIKMRLVYNGISFVSIYHQGTSMAKFSFPLLGSLLWRRVSGQQQMFAISKAQTIHKSNILLKQLTMVSSKSPGLGGGASKRLRTYNILYKPKLTHGLHNVASVFGHCTPGFYPRTRLTPQKAVQVRYFPTLNQIRKQKPRTKRKKPKIPIPKDKKILIGPQRRGVCVKLVVRTPKKPNSAQRKCAILRLSNGKLITAYIPGEKGVLQEHGVVLFEGGRVQDCPGIKYKIIRRKYDMN